MEVYYLDLMKQDRHTVERINCPDNSGHDDENAPHSLGVAMLIAQEAEGVLIGWEAHGPRLMKASF